MPETYQSGTKPLRIEWVSEQTEGVTPDDPVFEPFSDNILSAWDWEPDANTTRQNAAGEITAQGYFNGAETHEAAFEYDLQRWWVDSNGDARDPGFYFIKPAADNSLRQTHTVVSRSEHDSGGADGAGRRIYTVGKGGHPDTLTAPFETQDGSPVAQELNYQFEKVRQYEISQPASSTTLDVTNNGTTSVDVTIEDEGAATAETVTVAGGSTVTTVDSFADIDAVELSTDVDGDVEVTDGSGTTFVTISGSNRYPADEGDLGVPALGGGSRASSIGTAFVRFLDGTLSLPNVDSSQVEIASGEFTSETGLTATAVTGPTASQDIVAEEFSRTLTATISGEKVSVTQTENYLQENTGEISLTTGEGSLDILGAFIQSPGSYTKEAGNGKNSYDNEFAATEGVTLSA